MSSLPVRKYIKVWIEKRQNRKSKSYTLEWVEFGERRFLSLGPHATLAYAREAARRKEAEVNSPERLDALDPITWEGFATKYLNGIYPGHDQPKGRRRTEAWSKSWGTMKREKNAMESFARLVRPHWCHEITAEDRESFVQKRLPEVGSAFTVDAELRALRLLFNVMEEWKHRPEGSNPFAGRGKATIGSRRKRHKEQQKTTEDKAKHYSFEQVKAILALATKEADDADDKSRFQKRRLRALVYFVAYTGCRFGEAVHLEWKDIDWEKGIAWLYFKVENDLKTEGSQAPFGLPPRLLAALQEWRDDPDRVDCTWVFPNKEEKPWKTGGPGYRPFDQLKAIGERAGVKDANFKRFRHSLSTHGKQRFGMTKEQVQAQLRHTSTDTQRHYDHDDLANLRDAVGGVDFGQ